MDFKKLKTKSIVQALTDEILEQIKHGTLKPGDALPSQRQLVEQYDQHIRAHTLMYLIISFMKVTH